MMPEPVNPVSSQLSVSKQLLGEFTRTQEENSTSTKISQEALIDGKKIKITLTFDQAIDDTQARKAMNDNLKKVAELTIAYKLGEQDTHTQETTRSLILHKDAKLIRYYTKGASEEIHAVPYESEEVKDAVSRAIASYIARNPGSMGINRPVPIEVPFIPAKNFPTPVSLPVNLTADKSSPQGRYFEYEFNVNGKKIKEKAYRAETVSMLKEGLEAKIERLDAKIKEFDKETATPEISAKLQKIQKELDRAKADLDKYGESLEGVTHGSTNTPRFVFMAKGREGAKEQMAPVLPNLRAQIVENAEGEKVSALTRSAAISDFRYGEVSLQELQDLEKLLKELDDSEGGNQVVEEGKSHLDIMKKFYAADDGKDLVLLIKTKALVGYGADALVSGNQDTQLPDLLTKIQTSSSSIEHVFKGLSQEDRRVLEDAAINTEKLNEVISERTAFLKQLVIQDLQLNFETTPVKNGGPILYSRTSLVDLLKPANNEAGCIIHERTQGLDMKALLDGLKDAPIEFDKDLKAAYIDEEGVIHMPAHCAEGGVAKATLNPVFFNICVQGSRGHMLNTGMQKAINDDALANLEKAIKTKYGEAYQTTAEFKEWNMLKEYLHSMETSEALDPNTAALMVTKLVKKLDGYSGIGCYGAKDRTAYVVALVTHDAITELVEIDATPEEKLALDEVLKEVGYQLLSADGIAGQIAKDNADHTTLKLTRIDLELYDFDSFKGKMLRAAHFVNGAFNALKPIIISNFIGGPPLSVSSTPGQIYKEEAEQAFITSSKANSVFDGFLSFLRSKKDIPDPDQVGVDLVVFEPHE